MVLQDKHSRGRWYFKLNERPQVSWLTQDQFSIVLNSEGRKVGDFDEQRDWSGGRGKEGQTMIGNRITIKLALPGRDLSPNARCHWSKKDRARAALKEAAWALCLEQMGTERPRWEKASGQAAFYWPDARRRDFDNAAASIKAAWDGIVASGLIEDDRAGCLEIEKPIFAVDRENPRVEITITRLDPPAE